MRRTTFLWVAVFTTVQSFSQHSDALTAADYERAQKMLASFTAPLVDYGSLDPNWINGTNKFWYRSLTANGSEFTLVDPAKKTKRPAFDAAKMAKSLTDATGINYDANHLPFEKISFSPDEKTIFFTVGKTNYACELPQYTIAESSAPAKKTAGRYEVSSPDGKTVAFIKAYNLWVKDLETGAEKQLTTDGEQYYGYATANAGWVHGPGAVLRWSPDSKKIATYKQDERKVGDMYLVSTNVGHPKLDAWKYPLPGDSNIIMIEPVIITVADGSKVPLKMAPEPRRSTLGDDISNKGTWGDVDWSADGSQLAIVKTSRDHKQETVQIADAATGAVRTVFTEISPTQYESGQGDINWQYLAKSQEMIWYSEKDDYGHLYLYDAQTGQLKNQITKGNYVVTRIIKVDEEKRVVYFMAAGNDPVNPYFMHLCSAAFDGGKFTDLTPETGTHSINFSPDYDYFVDEYSQPDVPAVFELKAISGKTLLPLEKTDISRLLATGWKKPQVFNTVAHDGKTLVYGLLFTPTKLDTTASYPIIDYIYPGPQGGSVGRWSFSASRGDHQALSELGFVVMLLEGTGNPLRSKSFHDMPYGNMATNTLPDQVGAIRQLASRYSFIDTSRVGIWGHSGGGFATAAAMFRYPDFFKVGISESGNHDNRNYEDDWGERYNGLLVKNSDGTDNYDSQANQLYAKNLKGKLLLAHGLMDDNVPPSNTLLVVEALEEANKDYDLIIFPSARHGYGSFGNYMMRRRWDYFVENLLHKTPPKEFKIQTEKDQRNNFAPVSSRR